MIYTLLLCNTAYQTSLTEPYYHHKASSDFSQEDMVKSDSKQKHKNAAQYP